MRKFFIFILVLVPLLFFGTPILAKRVLPQARPKTGAVRSRGVAATVKFRADRLAIIVSFANLSVASKVDYILSYSTRGTTQGASGTLTPTSGETVSRELLFGTCSHGVCRYDYGITNARLVITTTLKNGLRIVKSFRLKV